MTGQGSLFGPPGPTLAEARKALMDHGRWEKPGGVVCPCCDGRAKVYTRDMNRTQARSFIAIAREQRRVGEGVWIHAPTLLRRLLLNGNNDAGLLAYWGLLAARIGQKADGNPRVGFYRMTEKGWAFLRGEITVQSAIVMYQGEHLGFAGRDIRLADALGQSFDYAEVMRPVTPTEVLR